MRESFICIIKSFLSLKVFHAAEELLLKLCMSMFMHATEAYSEPTKTSKMECLAKKNLQKNPDLSCLTGFRNTPLENDLKRIIQKLHNPKLLNINILHSPDTQTSGVTAY